jgi:hypothetical protein
MPNLQPNQFSLPVSIADLLENDFHLHTQLLTKNTLIKLENKCTLPAEMMVEKRELHGVITRYQLLERHGKRLGVQLFLRKPIIQITDRTRTNSQPLPGYCQVEGTTSSYRIRFEPPGAGWL